MDDWASRRRLRPTDVDEGMWPILERINSSGWVESTFSCAGHWVEDGEAWASNPYVQVRVQGRDLGRLVECLQFAVEDSASEEGVVDAHFVFHPDTLTTWRASLHYLGADSRPVTEAVAARGRALLLHFAGRL